MSDQQDHFAVNVSFGANSQEFDVKAGSTVQAVLENTYIRELIGFKGGRDETVVVNGSNVGKDYVLKPDDRIEVIKAAGDKA